MSYAGHYSLLTGHLGDSSVQVDDRFKRVLAASLVMHAVLLLGLMSVRFSPTIQQPLASYRVSLVTLPEPRVAPSIKKPTSVKKAKVPPPAKLQAAKPVPTPAVTKPSPPLKKSSPPTPVVPQPAPQAVAPIQTEQVTDSIVGAVESVAVPQSRELTPIVKAPTVIKSPTQTVRKDSENLAAPLPIVPQAPQLSIQKASPKRPAPASSTPTSSLADTLKQAMQSVAIPQKPQAQNAQIPASATPKAEKIISPTPKPTKATPKSRPQSRVSDSLKQVMQSVVVPELKKSPVSPTKNVQAVPVPSPSNQESRQQPRKELEGIVMPSEAPKLAAVDRSKIQAPLRESSDEVLSKPVQQDAVNENIAKLMIPDVQAPKTHHILSKPLDSGIQNTTTTLQVSGSSPEGNAYWGRVWSKIDREWVAPTVDVSSGKPLRVILAFRIERNGEVKNLAIEQSSGNEYYDVAAKRAVLDATPLPSFAPDMPESYYDIQFQFTVNLDS